ncbi:MAG: helical backbone metal receptor [Bacteroidetes bacterium]|nr:helical backbone metal receptor [Bacteroidota bacterium]
MNLYFDQLNRKIELPFPPKRIISLVPSQTELLYDLGLRDEVVGITKFCIHPDEWFHTKIHIGGTKKIDFDKIKQLNPDLIIGNKEENEKGQIEQLMKDHTVWMSDIYTLKDALNMIVQVGTLVGKPQESIYLKLQIESQFNDLNFKLSTFNSKLNATYFIWRKPFMVAGSNTFIDDMLSRCGLNNVFASSDSIRYPEVSEQQIAEIKPEVILLSSEPYPFKEKHILELQSICPEAKIMIVDGELFSWYGSRLLQAPSYFEKIRETMTF